MNKNWLFLLVFTSLLLSIGIVSDSFADSVPPWVKQTAKWYSEGSVSEIEFLNAIKFLIENKIIVLGTPNPSEIPQQSTHQNISPWLNEDALVTKPRLEKCIILNSYYKNMGESKFRERFSYVNYLNSCISLYKDLMWKYDGEDRVEKLYEKFVEIRDKFKKTRAKITFEPTVRITSIIGTGSEKFQVNFNVCAGDAVIDKAKVLIKSEIESIQYGTSKDIPENVCRSYSTQINAKHASNIKIDILENVESNFSNQN